MDGPAIKIVSVDFLTSAAAAEGWPREPMEEVAFAGRSNVGKSSMINALCRRRKVARVSKAPGRTRLLNFFRVTLEDDQGCRRQVRFCDLPGYGFAKASKAERREWQQMIEGYAQARERLCAVVCIVDANVGPTDDDLQVVPWFRQLGRQAIVAATKIDRIPKHRRIPRAREIEKELTLAPGEVVGVSSTEGINLDALWAKILGACARPAAT
jgi:GTP-binding protein